MSDDENKIPADRRTEHNALNVLLIQHLERLNKQQEAGFAIQKSELRWRNVRFAGWFLLGAVSIAMWIAVTWVFYSPGPEASPGDDYASLIRLNGVIGEDEKISAQRVIPALNRAFRDKRAKGVVLLVNSPGGSPVQAGLIRERLIELRREHPEKKAITVAEDMLTSGAYMIATGTDDIYVNRDTVAGSIGVIIAGFGFDGVMHKYGVERRIFTAGTHKSFLDPYTPVQKDDVARARELLEETHQHFIEAVKEARGSRLNGSDSKLFNGDFWIGDKAVSLGLADGVADLNTALRKVFHVQYTRDYTPAQNLFERLQDRMPSLTQKVLGIEPTARFVMY